MEHEELAGWLRLVLAPGIGNTTARRLLAAFGLPDAIFAQSPDALRQFLTGPQTYSLHNEPEGFAAQLAATWSWLQQEDGMGRHRIVTLGDAQYPADLLQIEDPPCVLYLTGVSPASWPVAIAVVGSRNPTPQGLVNARQFGRSFAQAGFGVVSGLALGVDGAAHEGALEGAGSSERIATVAVVGTGLDRVYPRQHLALAQRIAQAGLIVSEYPIGTPPLPENFPKRNRIIAALSRGTVVVEAALQSGSLITARQAAEQGKDVFAIPGSIHSPQTRGCHALLKQGAKLVETAQDVLEEMHLPTSPVPVRDGGSEAVPNDGAGPDDSLLAALGFDPVSLDALQARTGLDTPHLQAHLLELELDGAIGRLPGGLFQRLGQA